MCCPEILVGLGGFEPPTSPLSGVRSNQLSYRPEHQAKSSDNSVARIRDAITSEQAMCVSAKRMFVRHTFFKGGDPAAGSPTATLLRLHPSHESYRGERPPEG